MRQSFERARRAPGIAAATTCPVLSGATLSSVPQIASVGARTPRRSRLKSWSISA
jgi:hypothetical protein